MFFFCVFPCLHITHNVCVCVYVCGLAAVQWRSSYIGCVGGNALAGPRAGFQMWSEASPAARPLTCFFHLQGQGDPSPSTLKRGGKLGASDLLGMLNKKNRHPPISMATKRRLMSCVNTGETWQPLATEGRSELKLRGGQNVHGDLK